MSSSLPVSSYIDIAPNEYVTKFSLNRNFEKLLRNDNYLYDKYGIAIDSTMSQEEKLKNIQTYNKFKTYSAGEFVFYKIQKDDTKFYILSSAQGQNTHKPLVSNNIYTNELYVINSDWWKIVGINSTNDNSLQKDKADMYVNANRAQFESNHQGNTDDLSAHPTGKLSLTDSSKLFTTVQNIKEDRSKFFYPGYLESMVADDTTYYGYMRKWDNGLLEYDLTFRLGYISSDANGLDLLSANNLVVKHRNRNFLYFQTDDDYKIFNQGGENYVVTSTSRQVNLNEKMNAYTGKITFIEPFKDLNYMVFTSNVKNIDTEAYNLKNKSISSYDKRLEIDGLTIKGHDSNALYILPCAIPNEIVNIRQDSLANIEQADTFPVVFTFNPWLSKLANIDSNAFAGTGIISIDIPASVRHIGENAFSNCSYLTCVNFYIYSDSISSQVRIDENAFPKTVKVVNFYQQSKPTAFSASYPHEDAFLYNIMSLYDKMCNPNYRSYIGMSPSTNEDIIKINAPIDVNTGMAIAASKFALTQNLIAPSQQTLDADIIDENQAQASMITIDLNDFLEELNALQKTSNLTKSSKMRFAATKVLPTANDVFLMSGTQITGFNSTGIDGNVEYDLNDMSTKPTSIASNALTSFYNLTGLTSNTELTGLCPNSLPTELESFTLRLSNGKSYKLSLDFNIQSISLSIDRDPASFVLSSKNRIENIYIDSIGNTIPTSAIVAPRIDNIYVNGPRLVDASAFVSVDIIGKVEISASPLGTTISSCAFSNRLSMIDEWPSVKAVDVNLIGNRWTIDQSAFAFIEQNYLSIDMIGSIMSAASFFYSSIAMLELKNITQAQRVELDPGVGTSLSIYGFCREALASANIFEMGFPDLTIAQITSEYFTPEILSTTLLGEHDPNSATIVRGNDTVSVWLSSESLHKFTYMDINNTSIRQFNYSGMTITGLYDGNSYDNIEEEIIVPYGVTAISSNAFGTTNDAELAGALSRVKKLHIPRTLKTIGDNAFSGLSCLEDLIIDPGTALTSIGQHVFKNCFALNAVKFYS